jgi:putative FmdB family regulatory protein
VPIYEYGCTACRKRSSALLPTWSAPDPPCPHCGQASLRRLVSSFATVRSEELGFDSDDAGDDFESGGGGDFGDDDW